MANTNAFSMDELMANIKKNTKAKPVVRKSKTAAIPVDIIASKGASTNFSLHVPSQHEAGSAPKEEETKDKAQTATQTSPMQDGGLADLISRAVRARQVGIETEKKLAKDTVYSAPSDFASVFHNPDQQIAVLGANSPVIEKEKVAAYIRVSTDSTDQENSYETQERYFNHLLASNPMWVSVGIYSDYGISGTSKAGRTGFKRLLRHCQEGRINRIICKSISRFARNTADFLAALQILKDNDVTILFEKEGLDTANPMNDFVVTTLAAVAQQESYSISQNQRLSFDKRAQNGEAPNREIYGYRYNGKWITMNSGYRYKAVDIVEEEAAVVRRIFTQVAEGKSYMEIARELNWEGIPAPERQKGKEKKGKLNDDIDQGWTGARVSRLVSNERYAGDVEIQKTYTEDCLTHKHRINNGEVPRYVIRDHHPAIVDHELYEKVKKIMEAQKGGTGYARANRTYSGMLICANCGRFFNVRNGNRNPIWFCPSTVLYNGKHICQSERVYEKQVELMLRKAILERFGENTGEVDESNAPLAEILNTCAASEEGFVEKMIARLEAVQSHDNTERDRALLGRRVSAVRLGNERMEQHIGFLVSQKEMMQARRELLGDETITDEMIAKKDAEIEEEKAKLESGIADTKKQVEQYETLAKYWEELEDSYDEREGAIRWMKGLLGNEKTQADFLDGLQEHLKAFVFSITAHSPTLFTVHWFDNTKSDVTMYGNVDEGINKR